MPIRFSQQRALLLAATLATALAACPAAAQQSTPTPPPPTPNQPTSDAATKLRARHRAATALREAIDADDAAYRARLAAQPAG